MGRHDFKCLTSIDHYMKGEIYNCSEDQRCNTLVKLGYLIKYEPEEKETELEVNEKIKYDIEEDDE